MRPIPFQSKKWYTIIIWRIFDLMREFRLFSFINGIAKFLRPSSQLQQIHFIASLPCLHLQDSVFKPRRHHP
ncbi:unnamed protein product [Rotaria socialis]|uniref:Uncharacterized protein n=1 Tax=Rotaria socialis TaxID=392032 RepID=A0A821E3C2_9BILA|nr:unnamed protein product [Rotaria socialis]CAF4630339.1 unnamed protein product [Rotaria socialis]CAF4868722.1 unnamed protein product [Rotaria socialis]